MPSCQAFGCSNTSGKTKAKIRKSYFMIPRPVNDSERERAGKWLHDMGTGHTVCKFKFGKDKVLCSDHFHEDCIKEDLRAKYMGHKPIVHLKEGAIPTIFGYRVYDEINMDGTTVLSRSTSTKRSQKREHRQVCSMCLLLE